jgi:hypothetical protein
LAVSVGSPSASTPIAIRLASRSSVPILPGRKH